MPIEIIDFEKNYGPVALEVVQPETTGVSIRTQVLASDSAFACALGVAYAQPGLPSADAAPRPAPSGETCQEKVAFYLKHGALFGKMEPSDCGGRPEIGANIQEIEKAGRYFDYNPVGGVAVSACESSLDDDAVGMVDSRDNGLFQQHNPYWFGRLIDTRSYIKTRTKPNKRPFKLPDNIFNARSNAFVSVHMLRRGGGTTHWAPSRSCWDGKYNEVAGSQTRLANWFALKVNNR